MVVGMHRSGTSALTRVISLLGVDLPKKLYPDRFGNPTGHWESEAANQLNEAMLADMKSGYDDPLPLPDAWFTSGAAQTFVDQLHGFLRQEFEHSQLFVIKDPRLSIVLPLWIEALKRFEAQISCVLIIRNPLEVAQSLVIRNGWPISKGLALWLKYALCGERHTRSLNRSFTFYHELLEDWRNTARRVSAELDLAWPHCDLRTGGEIDRFLSQTLRHHNIQDSDLSVYPLMSEWVLAAFNALKHIREDEVGAIKALDKIGQDWLRAGKTFGPLVVDLELRRAADVDRLQHSLAEHVKHVADLEADRKYMRTQLGKAAANAAAQSNRIASLQDEIASRYAEISQLCGEVSRRALDFEQSQQKNAELKQAIVAGQQEIAGLKQIVTIGQMEVAALRASTSWRITAPLRAIKTLGRGAKMKVAPRTANVELISGSGLFNEAYYLGTADARAKGLDPIDHYLTEGEAAGLAPSALFDPAFYRTRYADLKNFADGLLCHYIRFGQAEGRIPRSLVNNLDFPLGHLSPARDTVLVIAHEASRTGAPILAWNIVGELEKRYNVIALLKRGGSIRKAFLDGASAVVTLPDGFVVDEANVEQLIGKLVLHYKPRYVVACSAETREFVPSFERAGIPVIALVHEFSSNVGPLGTLLGLFASASQVVFSANIVAESALADYRQLKARRYRVLPQGPCRQPAVSNSTRGDLSQLPGHDGSILVIGIGEIQIRKGVEFFISAAAAVQRRNPARRIIFAWVGMCRFEDQYFAYLNEQITRSGIQSSFAFLGEFEDLEPIYARADICFLSSRLDPLPNIAIDSAVRGIPVICFDRAGGFAEILKSAEGTKDLVVPYLDADAAAQRVFELAEDPARRYAFSEATRAVASEHFDMVRYVEAIDAMGCDAVQAKMREQRDHQVIVQHQGFNADLYLGRHAAATTTDEAIARYLHASRLVVPRDRPHSGLLLRRPLEGFHPLVYATENPQYDEESGEDPLAHYCRTGRPDGRWEHKIIRPGAEPRATVSLRVGIHGHFHYPDLLADFLDRLRCNATSAELLLTTTSDDRALAISEILSKSNVHSAMVSVVPNRGRNIGALLSAYDVSVLDGFDVLGHFHGKRSPQFDLSVGNTWRNFLWESLVGGEHAMIDVIVQAFAADTRLGLVFAEDPGLNDWDDNRALAEGFASRMGLRLPLPNHFDFPIGTMFWIRPQALRPLLNLSLSWDDYPSEPVPIDGTSLHALERLIPFSASHAGYYCAATYLKNWTR